MLLCLWSILWTLDMLAGWLLQISERTGSVWDLAWCNPAIAGQLPTLLSAQNITWLTCSSVSRVHFILGNFVRVVTLCKMKFCKKKFVSKVNVPRLIVLYLYKAQSDPSKLKKNLQRIQRKEVKFLTTPLACRPRQFGAWWCVGRLA